MGVTREMMKAKKANGKKYTETERESERMWMNKANEEYDKKKIK